MELPPELKSKSETELEEWYLGALSADPLPLDAMLAALAGLADAGHAQRSAEWSELLQELLAERGDRDGLLRLLSVRAERVGDPGAVREAWRGSLVRVSRSRMLLAHVESAGFDDPSVSLAECLRRTALLSRLAPGAKCYDKTWGFGVVRDADDFYRRYTVDFVRKPGHRMSFSYAAESLRVVPDDHLLARRYGEPEQLARMVKEAPGEVVRLALRSYGELSAPRLREVLVPEVLADGEWKTFWDAARQELKADRRVEIPGRRNDPIRLLDEAKRYDERWLAGFEQERDPLRILGFVNEFMRESGAGEVAPAFRAALARRLAFAATGSEGKREDLVARVVVAADRLGLSAAEFDSTALTARLTGPDVFVRACSMLNGRDLRSFLDRLMARNAAGTLDLLLAVLDRLTAPAIAESVSLLCAAAREAECAQRLRAATAAGMAAAPLLIWQCEHLDRVTSWALGSVSDLLIRAVNCLELPASGEEYRAQKQLRAFFEEAEWLAQALSLLTDDQRQSLLLRVNGSSGWDAVSRRGVLARMIRAYPDLAALLEGEAGPRPEGTRKSGRVTSWRSFRERAEQLRLLVEKEVPANSREIAVARSYGDLRENAEFKAAKEHQRILQQRRTELEQALESVQGTDFTGGPTDRAGPGTQVEVCRPSGAVERYCILGEWDRDERLGIISSQSRLAELLSGRAAGEPVSLPADSGEELCTIAAISGLPEEVRAWISAGSG